ncbi:hypothetical protein G6F62_015935 [Rhizopus arrhizus]|nr:hypothetical protein G6F62_015935 [Rhizopus arrhizus]
MPPMTIVRVRPRRSTMPSPNRRIAVIASVNNAKPAPAWSRGPGPTSARDPPRPARLQPAGRAPPPPTTDHVAIST